MFVLFDYHKNCQKIVDKIQQNSSMAYLQRLKRMIYSSDMFCSSEMLRYDSETQYKTLTGGIISICIIVFILIAFASMISDTFNRLTISSSLQTIKKSNPGRSVLRTDEKNMFMFGVSIKTADLATTIDINSKRYFDMMIGIGTTVNGMAVSQQYVALEKCTVDHWKMLPDVAERYDGLQANKWLCFPLNRDYPLEGAFSSTSNSGLVLYVSKCTNNPLFSQPCAPQAQIDFLIKDYSNFFYNIHYINPVISPSEPDHISYYLESSDFLIFSNTMGACAYIQVSEYTINTDNSIWPLTNTVVQTGSIIEQKAISRPISISPASPYYASIFISKSINSLVYTREVQKISAVLSYIGGLVGAITAFLFLIKSYTGSSFQISIGSNLFDDQKNSGQDGSEDEKSKISDKPSFNFFQYVGLTIYQLLKELGLRKKWDSNDRILEFQNEAIYQLDVKTLIKRVIHLELWMTYLFNDSQLEGLKHQKSLSFAKSKQIRELISHCVGDGSQFDQNNSQFESSSQKVRLKSIQIEPTEHSFITPKIFLNQIINMGQSEKVDKNIELAIPNSENQREKESQLESDKEGSVPVQFLSNKKRSQIKILKQKGKKSMELSQQAILYLRQLRTKAKEDRRSEKIWSNLREEVQSIVAGKKVETIEPVFFRRAENII